MLLFEVQAGLQMIVTLALFAFQAWAFVDALTQRSDAYPAADKLTKPTWLIILGVALAAHMLIWAPFHVLNLVGAVATIVYLVDVRPTLRALTRR